MISIAIVVGFIVANHRFKKLNLTTDDLLDLLLFLLIGGIVGAKLLFILTNEFFYYVQNPIEIFRTGGEGFSFFGVVLAGIPISWFFARKKKINYWALVDILSLSVMIGYAIGRIGCFLNGCCFGVPVNPHLFSSIFAVVFRHHDYARYPSQLFVSFGAFISFFLMRWIDKAKSFYGATFASFFIFYGTLTLIVDNYRDMELFPPWNLTLSQYLSLLLIPLGILLLIYFSKTQQFVAIEGKRDISTGSMVDQSQFTEESNEVYME